MGHWEQIGRDNAAERARREQRPRWRRALCGTAPIIAAVWIVSLAIGLRIFGVL